MATKTTAAKVSGYSSSIVLVDLMGAQMYEWIRAPELEEILIRKITGDCRHAGVCSKRIAEILHSVFGRN